MNVVKAILATSVVAALGSALPVTAEGHHWSSGKHGGPAERGELDHSFASSSRRESAVSQNSSRKSRTDANPCTRTA